MVLLPSSSSPYFPPPLPPLHLLCENPFSSFFLSRWYPKALKKDAVLARAHGELAWEERVASKASTFIILFLSFSFFLMPCRAPTRILRAHARVSASMNVSVFTLDMCYWDKIGHRVKWSKDDSPVYSHPTFFQ